jgi:hypothetical protein
VSKKQAGDARVGRLVEGTTATKAPDHQQIQLLTVGQTPAILASQFLTTLELCAVLRCSEKTIQRYRKRRLIGYVRRCGRFLYSRAAVEQFIQSRTVAA